MPRKLRIECPGTMYHLMSRGDRRERIFLHNIDRHVDRVLGEHGIQQDTAAGRQRL